MKWEPRSPMVAVKPTNCSDKKSACGRFFFCFCLQALVAGRMFGSLQTTLSPQPLADQKQGADVARFVKVFIIQQRH